MSNTQALHELGQSIWLDYIRRSFLDDGGLASAIDAGVRGVTSNPSIFEKAIAGSMDYDTDLRALVTQGKSTEVIFETLAVADIQRAADLLRPIYDASQGVDGYISLEVSPTLADDTERTISEARRLNAAVGRPNVMIKVPATEAGIPAIRTLIAAGINVNVTLIFGIGQYERVAEAYIAGLEDRAASGGDLSRMASVASFFVSRVDSAVDAALEAAGNTDLRGKIAIANSKLAYDRFKSLFAGERWAALAAKGARVQRLLWASTSTKNPHYRETMYVDGLIGPDTVNTVPPATLDALRDHATVARTLDDDVESARAAIARLAELGIDLDTITADLLQDGVKKFADSFAALMQSIETRREQIETEWQMIEMKLGAYVTAVDAARLRLREERVMDRIWNFDHTVWADQPDEITNRLGWLHAPDRYTEGLERLQHLVRRSREDGYTQVLLLGMGGSSLAPEVFRKTFGVAPDHLDLAVLDSTDPGAVLAYDAALDPAKTLFIVATKSGGTAETLSFFKFFYNRTAAAVGKEAAGQHFVAITDPGSKLETMASEYGFRATFLNDPNIGGRYSALSFFGIVPAALLGVDVARLLERASTMAVNCSRYNCPSQGNNLGGIIGAILGELANAGRDKVTFITSPAIASFGDWVEQLIAESTGKHGKGILPVVGEPVGGPAVYHNDRVFFYLRLKGDDSHDTAVAVLAEAGHPTITLHLADLYDLGGQFFLWEMATAVSGFFLGIQPFDQPNVESAKVQARKMIAAYQETGKLPELPVALSGDGMTVYGDAVNASTPMDAFRAFIDGARQGDYVSFHAYVQPTVETTAALAALQAAVRDSKRLATTVGYGPRFLHSTGQLHKGDSGNGLFVQFTATMPQDVMIPDQAGETASTMSFGTLKLAQALGDRRALLDADRRVLCIDLGVDVPGTLEKLAAALR